jgi:hypothetical protein
MKYPNMVDPTKKDMEQLGAIRHYLDTHQQPTVDHSMDADDEALGRSCIILGIAFLIIFIIIIAVSCTG